MLAFVAYLKSEALEEYKRQHLEWTITRAAGAEMEAPEFPDILEPWEPPDGLDS